MYENPSEINEFVVGDLQPGTTYTVDALVRLTDGEASSVTTKAVFCTGKEPTLLSDYVSHYSIIFAKDLENIACWVECLHSFKQ